MGLHPLSPGTAGAATASGRPAPRRRALLGAAAVGAGAALGAVAPTAHGTLAGARRRPEVAPLDDAAVAREIREEFLHSWYGYVNTAWGYDEIRPVSEGRNDFFVRGRTFGLSIAEALDTLHLMGEDHEVQRCCAWLENELDVAQDADVHVFEMIIRMVGGLLAAHLATGRKALLDRCRELANRLLPAFTASPTGIPFTRVNLRTGAVSGSDVPLAEVGTNVMEFGLLSRLTGDAKYYDASMRAYRAVMARRSSLDLLGTRINAENGRWTQTDSIAPNPPVDSFYEYLWAGGELLGDAQLLSWYRTLTDAVLKRQAYQEGGRLWFQRVDPATGARRGSRQSELGAFYAGLLAKGGNMTEGVAFYRSWTDVLKVYPVLPEEIDPAGLAPAHRANDLRPEYVNSSFDLWQLTGESVYKETAYAYFTAMREHLRVANGYTVASDVTTRPMKLGDLTPGWWFAENLKYLYLIFSRCPRFDYAKGLLSTEGKVLRGFLPG
ncbi:glycoside hydrolase family 47 protein [Streptomyces sp. URMC 123]|uniref:glycoside hydrolase family 47 protein n=1 Tax=Streptomyces sp. URMC 123 TaxID=3423403 RepID=UPI003F19EC93